MHRTALLLSKPYIVASHTRRNRLKRDTRIWGIWNTQPSHCSVRLTICRFLRVLRFTSDILDCSITHAHCVFYAPKSLTTPTQCAAYFKAPILWLFNPESGKYLTSSRWAEDRLRINSNCPTTNRLSESTIATLRRLHLYLRTYLRKATAAVKRDYGSQKRAQSAGPKWPKQPPENQSCQLRSAGASTK